MRLGSQIPIMLRSSFCSLYEHTDKELTDLGECPYDQVRPCQKLLLLLQVARRHELVFHQVGTMYVHCWLV